jgi:cytochrome d ubiquinol oxidase subunit II
MPEWLDLTVVWALLLATAVFLYVVLDGFDLGVGILFAAIRGRSERDVAVNSVAPVWDGNETWLVLGGVGLMPVFPLAYATILPALYMPVIVMLLALVFRGVAFEMRFKADSDEARLWWDRGFWWGSTAAAFCQGITLGALVQGIAVEEGAYAGGWWDWLTPFSVLVGVALIAGYGLLGACWLVLKTEGAVQAHALRLAWPLALATVGFIVLVSLIMPFLQPAFRARWFDFPAILLAAPVPLLVALLVWWLFRRLASIERDAAARPPAPPRQVIWRDGAPFLAALGLFLLSYIGLGISMWPLIVPPEITIWDAAAPRATQVFLLVGAVVLIPMILAYNAYAYWLFRGKVREGVGYH